MKRYTAIRRTQFSLEEFIENYKGPALGNAGVNAKGDRVDHTGKIVETAAEIAAKYHESNKNKIQQIPLSELPDAFFQPVEEIAAVIAEQQIKRADKSKSKQS